MKIINLIENTEGSKGCASAHGLSFYVETEKHKVLMDLGPTAATLDNAAILGVDLEQVDTVILSHGHYDHAGGILPFAGVNSHAPIYMQEGATGNFFSDYGESAAGDRYRYIGIDRAISDLPQVRFIRGDHIIDEELELFVVKKRTHKLPFANRRQLIRTEDGFIQDDFVHEQFLVVKEQDRRVLMSGCAHNGILSILDAYRERYDSLPDAVISGFHIMMRREYRREELEEIREMAKELSRYPILFCTCHCTGTAAFEEMKKIMGGQLRYIHCGDEPFQ